MPSAQSVNKNNQITIMMRPYKVVIYFQTKYFNDNKIVEKGVLDYEKPSTNI